MQFSGTEIVRLHRVVDQVIQLEGDRLVSFNPMQLPRPSIPGGVTALGVRAEGGKFIYVFQNLSLIHI